MAFANPVDGGPTGGIVNISVGLKPVPFPTPLSIKIINTAGLSLIQVYNAYPPWLDNVFVVDVSSLIPGIYNVIYQIGDEIISVPLMIQ